MQYASRFCLFVCLIFAIQSTFCQGFDSTSYTLVAAGPEYKKPGLFQALWGHNRRLEWTTPVHVRMLWLDREKGGLKPYKTGGGNETRSLRLASPAGKQYALRSVDKSRDDVIMPLFKNTLVATIIRDGVSMSYPYAALAVCRMEDSAHIYHPVPELVYLPSQPALDSFNEAFGNDLYFLEERPDGDWSDAAYLGNFKNFYGTDEVVETLKEDYRYAADQHAFIKARLFDMLLCDWDRHEGNWKWGLVNRNGRRYFEPVAMDRDQAFYTHNGVLIDVLLPLTGLGFMQNFDDDTRNITKLNKESVPFDRFFSNEMVLEDWLAAASLLQDELTDSVILQSVKQLPPEIFDISGNELVVKLQSRRQHLTKYAAQYYRFLAQKVAVIGTDKKEYFEIKGMPDTGTSVRIFTIDTAGQKQPVAFYKRIFKPSETKAISIYGIGGEDVYSIDGDTDGIRISIIGGPDRDQVLQSAGSSTIHIFDDDNNVFQTTAAKRHTAPTGDVPTFRYDGTH